MTGNIYTRTDKTGDRAGNWLITFYALLLLAVIGLVVYLVKH